MEHETALSKRLIKAGAEVFYYGILDFLPETRFTIINDGRVDARVAIGFKNNNGHHEIREFHKGHPIFALTSDIVGALRKTAEHAA
jgi:hypothetical protein